MRALFVVAILATAILAGCSGKGGEEDDLHAMCADGTEVHGEDHPGVNNTTELAKFCPKKNGTGTNSTSNSTSRAPNVLPTITLKTTDDSGEATDVTMLMGNLTFDATGSADADGNITGLAASVTDSNQTRTITLYDAATKKFTPKTLSFDRAGVIKVVVAIVDDRGGFATLNTSVYVDETTTITKQFTGVVPAYDANTMSDCGNTVLAESGQTAVDAFFVFPAAITVSDTASWLEVTITSGEVSFYVCDPTGVAISERGADHIETNNAEPLPAPSGIDGYYANLYHVAPGAPGETVTGTAITHYEPRPAAAA